MNISDVQKVTGLTLKSIRYYENVGLIKVKRDKNNGYRIYSKENIKTLKLIKILRFLDFSIEEVKSIFDNDDLLNSLEVKQKQLHNTCNDYSEKENICYNLIKNFDNDDLIIDNYFDTIDFLQSSDVTEFKKFMIEFFLLNKNALFIQTILFILPILHFFINILEKNYNSLLVNAVVSMICFSFILLIWKNYFDNKKLYKGYKQKCSLIPLIIILFIITIMSFVVSSYTVKYFLLPSDYIFWEFNYSCCLFFFFLFYITFIFYKKQKQKVFFWGSILFYGLALYSLLFSFTSVSNDKIIIRNFLHPDGTIYNYSDVDLVETGFGDKRKTKFYYRIYIEKNCITFRTPDYNDNTLKYSLEPFLFLEEFDIRLMDLNTKKESNDINSNLCYYDDDICERFNRIIDNK